jgi:hypothetical protein
MKQNVNTDIIFKHHLLVLRKKRRGDRHANSIAYHYT